MNTAFPGAEEFEGGREATPSEVDELKNLETERNRKIEARLGGLQTQLRWAKEDLTRDEEKLKEAVEEVKSGKDSVLLREIFEHSVKIGKRLVEHAERELENERIAEQEKETKHNVQSVLMEEKGFRSQN